jgi:hypothetical protein
VTHPLVSKQRIDGAVDSLSTVAKKRLEEVTDNQRAFERFFNNLALLSGGTVALSITYLGFLKTLAAQPLHQHWLVASWVLLVTCVICATFYSFFNTAYTHYGRSREYAQRLKEKNETMADEVPNISIIGIGSKSELDAYIKELRDAATLIGKDVEWAGRREKFCGFLFNACGVLARVSFVLGLTFLLLFATANVSSAPATPETGQVISSVPASPTRIGGAKSKDKVVEIPCVGIVTFPGTVSDDDTSAASKMLYERAREARAKEDKPTCDNQ